MSKAQELVRKIGKCRVCLSCEGCFSDIFKEELRPKVEELVKSTCIHIDAVEDAPSSICHVCLYKLEMWYDFREQFIRSNEILLQHLSHHETSNNVSAAKRRYNDIKSGLDNGSDCEKDAKKCKTQVKSMKTEDSCPTSLNPSPKPIEAVEIPTSNLTKPEEVPKIIKDSTSEGRSHAKSPRARNSSGRRTSEQRMASTQRWAARKQALRAATGANDTDTDSLCSDDNEYSLVEKSKETERLRRFTSSMNNLRSDKHYFTGFSDEKSFRPQSIQAESIIGDATFVVSSTLHLCDPQYLNEPLNNYPKIPNVHENKNDGNSLDATELFCVQTSQGITEKTFVERCLNIEVEGTDLEGLKRIQRELANFVETDMIEKLTNNLSMSVEEQQTPQDSLQTLEQQLKKIVERAVKNNLEITRTRPFNNTINDWSLPENRSFSSAFIKAAMKSEIFQPKVLLKRIDFSTQNSHSDQNIDSDCQEVICEDITKTNKIETKVDDGVKCKMMRCKKCQAIVNSRFVKSHVCQLAQKVEKQVKNPSPKPIEPVKSIENKEKAVYTCIVCDKIFIDEELLQNHLQQHRGNFSDDDTGNKIELYQCAMCCESFEFEEALKNHMEKHLFDEHEKRNSSNSIASKDDEQNHCQDQIMNSYSCSKCSEVFHTEIQLAFHMRAHEEDDDIAEWEIQGVTMINDNYTCTICDKKFHSEDILNEHFNSHNDFSQVCLLCDQYCASLTELRDHVNTH